MKTKTQQDIVLELLTEAGQSGVNSFDLTYKHSIKQAPTRVQELQELGYEIISVDQPDRSVNYILYGMKKSDKEREWKWEFSGTTAKKVYI